MRSIDADIIIIGSGFGGSVCACRAAQAGKKVIVLERGREITPSTWQAMVDGRLPFIHSTLTTGILELPKVRGLAAVTGCGLGGGSHVYTAVTVPAPNEIFESNWPAGITPPSMSPFFQKVSDMIAPTPIPVAMARTSALDAAGARIGASVTRLPQAMEWPANPLVMRESPMESPPRKALSTWLQGGLHSRKRTLDKTYLAVARAAGAETRPNHEVLAIIPENGFFRVEFMNMAEGISRKGRLIAPKVILAAGAIGTLRLLFECRDRWRCLPGVSSALGHRFFTNGDLGAMLVCNSQVVCPDSGPPVTAWLDHWATDRLYLMDLGHLPIPPMVAGFLAAYGLGRIPLGHSSGCWTIGVLGFDHAPGRILRDAAGLLLYRRGPAFPTVFDIRAMARLTELADALKARLVLPPEGILARYATTVHPLGGACMADSSSMGVTSAVGEVFGHPGLFIADGSLLPTPIGRAPSMTIAALAERVISHILEAC